MLFVRLWMFFFLSTFPIIQPSVREKKISLMSLKGKVIHLTLIWVQQHHSTFGIRSSSGS